MKECQEEVVNVAVVELENHQRRKVVGMVAPKTRLPVSLVNFLVAVARLQELRAVLASLFREPHARFGR